MEGKGFAQVIRCEGHSIPFHSAGVSITKLSQAQCNVLEQQSVNVENLRGREPPLVESNEYENGVFETLLS